MTNIESEKVIVNNTSEKIYNFLYDFNNFSKLMPEQVINWKSTTDECSFTIKGMIDICLQMGEKTPYSKIVYKSGKSFSLDFNMICAINKIDDSKCETQILFEADLNPMIRMMVENPLQNFVNILVKKLGELAGNI